MQEIGWYLRSIRAMLCDLFGYISVRQTDVALS
jgi:hypothetical protein